MSKRVPAILLASMIGQGSLAADVDPRTLFTWDVSHELAVMNQTPQQVAASTQPTRAIPQLQLDKSRGRSSSSICRHVES